MSGAGPTVSEAGEIKHLLGCTSTKLSSISPNRPLPPRANFRGIKKQQVAASEGNAFGRVVYCSKQPRKTQARQLPLWFPSFRACRLPWGAHTHPWIQTPGLEYTGDAVGAEALRTVSCSGATKHRLRSPTLSLRTLRVYFIKIATCLHDSSNSSSPLCRNFSHTPFFLIYVGPNYTQIINDCRSQSR